MACDLINRKAEEQLKRKAQLDALITKLFTGTAKIVRNGVKVSIEGWTERGGWCDACAVRAMKQHTDIRVRVLAENATKGVVLMYGHGH